MTAPCVSRQCPDPAPAVGASCGYLPRPGDEVLIGRSAANDADAGLFRVLEVSDSPRALRLPDPPAAVVIGYDLGAVSAPAAPGALVEREPEATRQRQPTPGWIYLFGYYIAEHGGTGPAEFHELYVRVAGLVVRRAPTAGDP